MVNRRRLSQLAGLALATAITGALALSATAQDKPLVQRRAMQITPAVEAQLPIPMEAVQGYPVPVFEDGVLWLVTYYFLRRGRPPQPPALTQPGWIARIDAATGQQVQSRSLEVDLSDTLGPHGFPKGFDMKAFDAAEADLYAALTALLGVAQFPDKQLTPEEEAAAARLRELWDLLYHKPLHPYYHALNPAFFDRIGIKG